MKLQVCEWCGNEFSKYCTINGKYHNLSGRKMCLKCNPHRDHEFKAIVIQLDRPDHEYIKSYCPSVAKHNLIASKKRKEHHIEYKKRAIQLLGGKCSKCGYNKCIEALEFHHVDPSLKSYGISSMLKTYLWDDIADELAKCILLCSNCHRELHANN